MSRSPVWALRTPLARSASSRVPGRLLAAEHAERHRPAHLAFVLQDEVIVDAERFQLGGLLQRRGPVALRRDEHPPAGGFLAAPLHEPRAERERRQRLLRLRCLGDGEAAPFAARAGRGRRLCRWRALCGNRWCRRLGAGVRRGGEAGRFPVPQHAYLLRADLPARRLRIDRAIERREMLEPGQQGQVRREQQEKEDPHGRPSGRGRADARQSFEHQILHVAARQVEPLDQRRAAAAGDQALRCPGPWCGTCAPPPRPARAGSRSRWRRSCCAGPPRSALPASGRRPVCSCSTKRIRSTPGRIRPPGTRPARTARPPWCRCRR